MLTVRTDQLQSLADGRPGRPVIAACPATATWIEVELLDADNQPVANRCYRIVLPDHSTIEGRLDADGKARVDGVVAGDCTVTFPEIDRREWDALDA